MIKKIDAVREQMHAIRGLRELQRRPDVEKLCGKLRVWPKNDPRMAGAHGSLPSLEIVDSLLLTPKGFRVADNVCGLSYSDHRAPRFWRLGPIPNASSYLHDVELSIAAQKSKPLAIVPSGNDHTDLREDGENPNSLRVKLRGLFCAYRR